MLRPNLFDLCYYSDEYLLVKGTITKTGAADEAAQAADNKTVISKYYTLLIT